MDSITLIFEPKTVDYIYNVLGQRPWAEANPVMVDLQRQVAQQQQSPMKGSTGPQEALNGSGEGVAAAAH